LKYTATANNDVIGTNGDIKIAGATPCFMNYVLQVPLHDGDLLEGNWNDRMYIG